MVAGGEVLRDVALEPPSEPSTVQSAGLSPDGAGRLVVTTEQGVSVYSAAGRLESSPLPESAAAGCPPSWSGSRSVFPVQGRPDEAVAVDLDGDPFVQADPRIGAGCSIWAADALSGPARDGVSGTLFGQSTSWVAWHWRELGLGLFVLVFVVGAAGWFRHRRRAA